MSQDLPYGEYLYQALTEKWGLVLDTTDVPFTLRKLREAKTASLDEALDVLKIIPSPTTEGQIWIIKDGSQGPRESDATPV